MRKFLFAVLITIGGLFTAVKAQYAPNMGSSAAYIFFSRTGAITNSGNSDITGDIGSNAGSISGFTGVTVFNGSIHAMDASSWKAEYDISVALGHLTTENQAVSLPSTIGSGATLTEGIYKTDVSSLLDGELILDGGGDLNAVFVFQVAGLFTTNQMASITLVNGARSCNVFWTVGAGVSIAAGTNFAGTLISRSGISFGQGCTFQGRAFSTAGNINLNSISAILPEGPFIATNEPDCFQASGSVTINAPTGPGFTYSLGSTFQQSSSFSNLGPGIYPVTVKAGNGDFISAGVNTVINPQFEPPVLINLGMAAKFVLYTGSGMISNSGTSYISKGDIGTNFGSCNGLNAPTVMGGTVHNPNGTTAQVATDLFAAYQQLKNQPVTGTVSGSPANGQLIQAGTYKIPGDFYMSGNLVLDGGGDPNAIFIFQINGALSSEARSFLILKNGARASRVFWAVAGPVNFGLHTTFAGTIVSNAAISFGGGSILKGRALSTLGNISFSNTLVMPPFLCAPASTAILPVLFGKVSAAAKDCAIQVDFTVLSQENNKRFDIERSNTATGNWTNIGSIPAAGIFSSAASYNYLDQSPLTTTNFYRIRQVDKDEKFSYSTIVSASRSCSGQVTITSFPNPFTNKLTVMIPAGLINSNIRLINATGQVVLANLSRSGENALELSNLPTGVYMLQVIQDSRIIYNKTVLKN